MTDTLKERAKKIVKDAAEYGKLAAEKHFGGVWIPHAVDAEKLSYAIEQALRDERERCAKIAEKQTVPGSGLYEWGKGANFNAAKIARLIREVTP